MFADIPAVFCGANDLDPTTLRGMGPITGVNENADVRDTLDLILHLLPATRRIVVVNDTTPTGRNVHREIAGIADAFSNRVAFDYLEDLPREDLLGRLRVLTSGDVVLYTFFFRDSTGRFFDYDDSARKISNASPVPVFSLWEFNLGHGIVGGKLVGGYTQGVAAGQMALRIISGEPADAIPIQMQSPNRFAFDYRVLQQFDIDASRLPPDHLIINRPASLYEEYEALIWSTLTAIVLLSVLVLVWLKLVNSALF